MPAGFINTNRIRCFTLCLCGAILEFFHDGIIVSEKTFVFLSGMVYSLKPVVEQIEVSKNREIQI